MLRPDPTTPTRGQAILPALAIVCYIAALFLPAFDLVAQRNGTRQPGTTSGGLVFTFGIFGLFDGQLAWLANPLAWLGLILLFRRRYSLSAAAAFLALIIAQQSWILVGKTPSWDMGGTMGVVTSPGAGFYLWCLSFVFLGLAAAQRHDQAAKRTTAGSR